jgi:hypothetical protein
MPLPSLGFMTAAPPDHGTYARYRRGCRCQPCRDANAAASAAKYERRKLAASGMLDPPPAHLKRRPEPAGKDPQPSPRPGSPGGPETARQNGRTRGGRTAARSRAPRVPRWPLTAQRPVQPRPAASAPAVVAAEVVAITRRRVAAPAAALPPAPRRLAIGARQGAPAAACDVRGCAQPGGRILDAYPGAAMPDILAEQAREARGSLPTRRCDRHAAELLTRWPAGTWHEEGSLRPPPAPREPQPGPPNPPVETCRLPWNPAAAPAGGGILASRPRPGG